MWDFWVNMWSCRDCRLPLQRARARCQCGPFIQKWADGAVLCPMAARSLRRGESHFCFHPQTPQKPFSPLRLNEPRDDTARLLRTHTRQGVTRSLKEAPFANTTDVPLELNVFLSLSPSEKRPYVSMILFSSRSVLLSVYYPQIFLILTSGSYL